MLGGGGEEDEEEAASREGRANAREVYHPVMPLRYPKQPRASPSTRRDSVSSRGRSRVMSTILGMTGGREGRGGGVAGGARTSVCYLPLPFNGGHA